MARKDGARKATRVRVTYEHSEGGFTHQRELPLVIGVIGDFAGQPKTRPPKLSRREFIEVSSENIDRVLKKLEPRLRFNVDNKLTGDDSRLVVDLSFTRLEDFEPEQVARQVEPLRELLELREKLALVRTSISRDSRTAEHESPSSVRRQPMTDGE